MSEGIEFLLELQANTDGAAKMVRELTKVAAATGAADAALKAAEKHTSSLGQAFHKGKEWVGEFGREAAASFTGMFAATAVFDGIKEGIHLLGELALEAFHAAGEAEQTRVAYQNMMGVEPANELLEYLDKLAKYTQFTDGELKQLGGTLIRAGYSGDAFKKALTAALDVAARPGAGDALSKAAEGVEILSRIALKGGISSRELLRAGVNEKEFFKDIAEQTGLGVKAVEEQLSQGKIGVDIIRESFYRSLQKKGGKVGDADFAMSRTLLAQTKKFKDIIPNLFEDLEKSGGIKNVTDMLSHVVEVFDPDGPTGQKIIGGLTKLIDKFGEFVNGIDFDKFSDRTVHALELVEKAGKALVWTFERLIDLWHGLKAIAGGPEGIEQAIIGHNNKTVSASHKSGNATIDAIAESLLSTGGISGKLGMDASQGLGERIGNWIAKGLGIGVKDRQGDVTKATEALGGAAEDGMMSSLDAHSPSRVFAKIGGYATKGFALGLRDGAADMQAEIDHTFSPDASVASGISGRGLGGDVHYEANVTINVSGGASREGADEMAESLRAQILRLFEQISAEGAGA